MRENCTGAGRPATNYDGTTNTGNCPVCNTIRSAELGIMDPHTVLVLLDCDDEADDVMVGGDAEANLDREIANQEGEDLSEEVDGELVIDITPDWAGMRAWVEHIHATDPATARRIADAMGSEAPTLPVG